MTTLTSTAPDLRSVDIRPEVNILAMLKNLNYKPWFALAEFVDNAVGSFQRDRGTSALDPDQERVTVRIHPNSAENSIRIVDDAAGIPLTDFPRAFRAADVPPDRTGLSEFGMGMKSAATWFGDKWSVETTVRGEPILRKITFDMEEITRGKIEALEVHETECAADDHYTVIELRDIHHFPVKRTVGKIKDHLRSIYRSFSRDGSLRLYYDAERLEYPEVTPLHQSPAWDPDAPARTWRREIHMEFSPGQSASGFVGIREKGSGAEAGFALLRRGRLILGSHDESYKPVEVVGQGNDYRAQRIYGEIQLEGFEVSHTKDGIKWGPTTEEEFIEALATELRHPQHDFDRQAREHRSTVKTRTERIVIERSTERVANKVPAAITAVEAAAITPGAVANVSESASAPLTDVNPVRRPDTVTPVTSWPGGSPQVHDVNNSTSTSIVAEVNSRQWHVTVTASWAPDGSDWLHVHRDDDEADSLIREYLQVRLNLNHPFAMQYRGTTEDSNSTLITFACAVAIASAVHRDTGGRSDFAPLLDVALRAMSRPAETTK